MSRSLNPDTSEAVQALQQNWRAEKESARVYRELAEPEKDPKRKAILLRLAEAEERHAERWEKKLAELGAAPPMLSDTFGKRVNRWFNRLAGVGVALKRLEAAEDRDQTRYEAQQGRALGQDVDAKQILKEIALEERAHAKVLQSMVPQLGPKTILDSILRREHWHGRGGSWVADAIYGVNDGLGSVFGIVSGVAGATNNQQHYVLISGLAGMIASALSMGAGAYLAVKSEREVYEAEISREKQEVEENPEEEIEEMALFYQLQGFEPADSQRMAEKIAKDPEQMVKVMAQSELGLSEQNFPNPWVSSSSAAISTAIGAFIPIVPFFFLSGFTAVLVAFAVSIAAHFAVGAAKTLITMRSWWASGLEMTLVGILEAVITYGLGSLFGAAG
jgi:VIT1/CCC1 family predicted Fe2+/Mn2+ transporter/rubrerythrin